MPTNFPFLRCFSTYLNCSFNFNGCAQSMCVEAIFLAYHDISLEFPPSRIGACQTKTPHHLHPTFTPLPRADHDRLKSSVHIIAGWSTSDLCYPVIFCLNLKLGSTSGGWILARTSGSTNHWASDVIRVQTPSNTRYEIGKSFGICHLVSGTKTGRRWKPVVFLS